jgi:SAM-dependent methyltransferase
MIVEKLLAAWRKRAAASTTGPLTTDERRRIVAAARSLSAGLTGERGLVGERYLDDIDLLGAYLFLWWPVSYAQGRLVFSEVEAPLGRMLDVGTGPGPLAMAALDSGASSVLAVDRSRAALDVIGLLDARIETRRWSFPERLPDGPFDTIVAGHLLNELDDPDRLADEMLARLQPGGRIVVIEPALRETSRGLLALRDRLVASGVAIHAPCFFRGPCPALTRLSDWCHAEHAALVPPLVAELAADTQLRRDAVKFSYLIAGRGQWPAVSDDQWRIVSEPLPEKGKLRLYGCGPQGRHALVQPTKLRSQQSIFGELRRGDVVAIATLVRRGDGLHLTLDSTVERIARRGRSSTD